MAATMAGTAATVHAFKNVKALRLAKLKASPTCPPLTIGKQGNVLPRDGICRRSDLSDTWSKKNGAFLRFKAVNFHFASGKEALELRPWGRS